MSDLISRQTAIEAMEQTYCDIERIKKRPVTKGEQAIFLDMRGVVRSLPSVEPEKCSDCISRKAATDRFDLVQSDDKCMGYDDILAFLSSLPSVEPERKWGIWTHEDTGVWICGVCGEEVGKMGDEYGVPKYNFCPYCGADMTWRCNL